MQLHAGMFEQLSSCKNELIQVHRKGRKQEEHPKDRGEEGLEEIVENGGEGKLKEDEEQENSGQREEEEDQMEMDSRKNKRISSKKCGRRGNSAATELDAEDKD